MAEEGEGGGRFRGSRGRWGGRMRFSWGGRMGGVAEGLVPASVGEGEG